MASDLGQGYCRLRGIGDDFSGLDYHHRWAKTYFQNSPDGSPTCSLKQRLPTLRMSQFYEVMLILPRQLDFREVDRLEGFLLKLLVGDGKPPSRRLFRESILTFLEVVPWPSPNCSCLLPAYVGKLRGYALKCRTRRRRAARRTCLGF